MHKSTKLYRSRTESSVCTRCGQQRDNHTKMCDRCRSAKNEEMRLRRGRNLRYRIAQYRQGAKTRNLVWELTDEQATTLFKQTCTFCGQKGHGIDRIDSNTGYVTNNVQPCCSRCNIAKNDMTNEQFIALAKRIAGNHE